MRILQISALAAGALVIIVSAAYFMGGRQFACAQWGAFCAAGEGPNAYDANDAAESDPFGLGEPEDALSLDESGAEDEIELAVVETPPPPAPKAKAPPQQAAPEPVPVPVMEQLIGVGPEETLEETYQDDEETVVVQGRRQLRPQWARTPGGRQLETAYPDRALERGLEGEASVRCEVQADGRLDCTRVAETPQYAGFGRAAERLAETYRHEARLEDGAPSVGAVVNFRVLFRLQEERRRGAPSTWR